MRVERALTCATDAKMFRTGRHPALGPLPALFGHEAAGTVEALGEGVRGLRAGDRVVVANSAPCGACSPCRRGRQSLCRSLVYLTGAFAELLLVPAAIVATNVLLVPDGVPAEHAAMVEPVACALHGAERSGAAPDDIVVVLGGGLQGCIIAATLAERGCRVWLSDPRESRRRRASDFGAERTFDAARDEVSIEAIRDETAEGLGADVVIEAVGRPEAWQAAVRLASPGAEVLLHGGCPAGSEVILPTDPLHYGELTIRGSYHHTPGAVRSALDLIARRALPLGELLGSSVSLADVPAALAVAGEKHPVAVA